MSKLQIYPVTVNDYIPFLCFVVEHNPELALQLAEKRFPSLKTMGELEVLTPIDIDRESTFIVDPELYIINHNDEIKYWLGDSSSYDETNTNLHLAELFDDALPTKESKESEDKDVELLPAKSSTKATDRKADKDSDKSTEENSERDSKNSEEKDEEKDKTVWV